MCDGELRAPGVEHDLWRSRWEGHDLNVGPSNPIDPAGAERLEHGFLCCEPAREMLSSVRSDTGMCQLSGSEVSRERGRGEVETEALKEPHLDNVNAMADDQHTCDRASLGSEMQVHWS